ncbi:MAG TPA: hypothetical protein VIS48_00800 [Candidatus Kryptonia bacterium]
MRSNITVTIAALVTVALLFAGCKKDEGGPLTPARKIEGTWKTALPVEFHINTDFCADSLELVATEDRTVTMEIKETSNYTVDITLSFTESNFTPISQNCNPTGYVPDVSPMYLRGDVSGAQLTILDSQYKLLGVFTFTTDLMQGTWGDLWCSAYCQDVYTETNALKLILQR